MSKWIDAHLTCSICSLMFNTQSHAVLRRLTDQSPRLKIAHPLIRSWKLGGYREYILSIPLVKIINPKVGYPALHVSWTWCSDKQDATSCASRRHKRMDLHHKTLNGPITSTTWNNEFSLNESKQMFVIDCIILFCPIVLLSRIWQNFNAPIWRLKWLSFL